MRRALTNGSDHDNISFPMYSIEYIRSVRRVERKIEEKAALGNQFCHSNLIKSKEMNLQHRDHK